MSFNSIYLIFVLPMDLYLRVDHQATIVSGTTYTIQIIN
jgi:hypothetical protein